MIDILISIVLCLQNAVFAILRSNMKDTTPIPTVLIYVETLKLFFSCFMIRKNIKDTFKGVHYILPSLTCFIIMNLISYWSITVVSASYYTVMMQMKLLWTVLFSYIILGTKYTLPQCSSVAIVCICCVNIAMKENSAATSKTTSYLATACIVLETVLSCLCSIYMQKIFDSCYNKLWIRNAQMSFFSILFYGSIIVYFDYRTIPTSVGILFSFLGALGGVLVALSLFYCGALPKVLSTSFSIVFITACETFYKKETPKFTIISFYIIASLSVLIYSYKSIGKGEHKNENKSGDENENLMSEGV